MRASPSQVQAVLLMAATSRAGVTESVDVAVSNTAAARHGDSTSPPGTKSTCKVIQAKSPIRITLGARCTKRVLLGGYVVGLPNTGVSLTILRALPIFEKLDDDSLKPLTRVAMLRAIARHTVVLHAGDRTDNIYFVLSGALKVQVSDEEGREVILSRLGPGELFGEMGVLDDHPRSATVLAVEASEVVVIGQADFKQCLAENPEVSLFIMRNLTKRLRLADRTIESLALLDVYGRVARLLLEAAETVDGRKVIAHKLSKQDIAKMIGASREMVSRVMRDLTAQGLILEQDGQLILVDLAAFRRHGDVESGA